LSSRLSRRRELRIEVTGRKSGQVVSIPVWFALEDETLYLLPARGSATQWYKNVLRNPSIHIDAGGSATDLHLVPITDPAAVSSVVEKFRAKYGDDGLKLYSGLDVAVRGDTR
jgi:hypothetical protein